MAEDEGRVSRVGPFLQFERKPFTPGASGFLLLIRAEEITLVAGDPYVTNLRLRGYAERVSFGGTPFLTGDVIRTICDIEGYDLDDDDDPEPSDNLQEIEGGLPGDEGWWDSGGGQEKP